MKLLRSPWVAGLLVGIALAGAGWKFWPRHTRPAAEPAGHTLPQAAAASLMTGTLTNNRTNRLWPETPIEMDLAESNYLRLADSSARDPFQMTTPAAPTVAVFSPLNALKLRAIWRQADNRVVVINDRVCLEGDTVEGFRLERVDGDCVWLKGPEKTEQLTFDRGDHPVPPPLIQKGAIPPRALLGAPLEPAAKPKS